MLVLCFTMICAAGCGQQTASETPTRPTSVKVVPVLQQDTSLTSEYAGQVRGLEEVRIQARVSGTIVEKYVHGGQFVSKGQPLFKIDSRQYESAVLSAQATLAQSKVTLANAQIDLQRDKELLAADAIAEQIVTTQQANVNAYQAVTMANAALLKKAQEDLDDTVVYSPIDGQLDVNDVAIGTYAVAGQTPLVTVGSINPIFVQFSISEMEYLKFSGLSKATTTNLGSATVHITLSNGTEYPMAGRMVQADRALAENTGTLTVKALFPNPHGVLLPGMFARVRLSGEIVPNALLVPERAIQQILDKSFVMVASEENKSITRPVTLGDKVGSYYIVKDGVKKGELVIVEGLTKLQEGMPLQVTVTTPEEMGFSVSGAASEKTQSNQAQQQAKPEQTEKSEKSEKSEQQPSETK